VGVKTISCSLFRNTKCEFTVLVLKRDQQILSSCFPPDAETNRLLYVTRVVSDVFIARLGKDRL